MKDDVFDQSGLAVSKKSGSSRVFIYIVIYIVIKRYHREYVTMFF